MLRAARASAAHDDGFTLIELLVVILLMGFLGAVTTAGLAQAMKNTRQDNNRVQNSAALDTILQRLIKQVRVADPIRSVGTSSVVVDLYPTSGCQRVEWRVTGTNLELRTLTYAATSACLLYPATATATTDTGYITQLSNITTATPFSYLDNSGTTLLTPTSATTKQVSVTLSQSQLENRAAITITASTYLRNAL